MWLQVTELSKLAKIAFGSSGVKVKVVDYLLCGKFFFIGHKVQNIDQFLCQRRLYRPFIDHFLLQILFIDHFRLNWFWRKIRKSNRIANERIEIELLIVYLL